jgi:hypothetical protein
LFEFGWNFLEVMSALGVGGDQFHYLIPVVIFDLEGFVETNVFALECVRHIPSPVILRITSAPHARWAIRKTT